MDLNDLESFVRTVEHGTITAAARSLGVPKSTVTRRVARLESALGLELLRRSARSFSVTNDGELLYRRSVGAMRELVDVSRSVTALSERPHGRLVIAAPDFARSETCAALLMEYRAQCPDVTVEVRMENRLVDLIEEGVDIAIRAHRDDIPGTGDLIARSFDMPPVNFYASPRYIEERGAIVHPTELERHDVALHSGAAGNVPARSSDGEALDLSIPNPAYEVNDSLLLRAIIESGAAIGPLMSFVAEPAVDRGELVRILPDWSIPAGKITLVWPPSRQLSPRVRAFIDLAEASMARGMSRGA